LLVPGNKTQQVVNNRKTAFFISLDCRMLIIGTPAEKNEKATGILLKV